MTVVLYGTPQNRSRFDNKAIASALENQQDGDTRMPVVLVVEDDWLLRQTMVDALVAAGWVTREAESAQTALQILNSGSAIDLLITDLRLGSDTDGWGVAQAFRRRNSDLPVIYVSANPVDESRQLTNSVFLTKPCDMSRLLEVCTTLCPAN